MLTRTSALDLISKEILIKTRCKNSLICIQIQDIYNIKKKIRKQRLNRYTSTQTLLKTLYRDRWFVKINFRRKIKKVKKLFFVKKDILEVLYKNSEILIMNWIYKINKYKISLLTIDDVTSLNSTFLIEFAFLTKKNEHYYEWVLYHLQVLYKSLDLFSSKVIAIDRDLTLINVIDTQYKSS